MRIEKSTRSAGVSMVELMIASSIVVLMAVTVGYYISQGQKSNLKIEGSGECRQVVEAIANDLKSKDNSYNITNFLPSPATQLPPLNNPLLGQPYYISNTSFKNYQNIQNTTTLFQQAYHFQKTINGNDDACITGPGIDVSPFLSANVKIPSDYKAILNVAAQNLTSHTPSNTCTEILNNVSPSSSTTPNTWGLWYQITVSHKVKTTGQSETCAAQNLVSYEKDTKEPSVTLDSTPVQGSNGVLGFSPNNVVQPGLVETPGVITNTLCGYPPAVRMDALIPFMSNEPGSLFLCASVSGAGIIAPPVPPPNAFAYCDGMTLVGAGNSPAKLTLDVGDLATNPPVGTRATRTRGFLIFQNLPENKYRFYVKAVDTAGNISTPVLVFFTVDLTRPVWIQNNPVLSSSGPAVDIATAPPQGSILTAGDLQSQQFLVGDPNTGRTVLYQCAIDSTPQFTGQINTQIGNESCSAVVVPGNQIVKAGVAGNTCSMTALANPAYVPGRHTLQATVSDVCGTATVGATASATWLNDAPTADPIKARHTPISGGLPIVQPYIRPKGGATLPTWSVQTQRANADLLAFPVGLEVPRLAGVTNNVKSRQPANGVIGISAGDLKADSMTNSCKYGKGFCAKVFNACGGIWGTAEDFGSAVVTPFEIKGGLGVGPGLGDECWTVPCETGLQCSLFGPDRGHCKIQDDFNCSPGNTKQWKCTNHSDCIGAGDECIDPATGLAMPWGNLVHNSGVCQTNLKRNCNSNIDCETGDGFIGRCKNGQCTCHDEAAIGSGGSEPACRSGSDYWAGICGGAAPACNCNVPDPATKCISDSYRNSCGVLDGCRGTATTAPICGDPIVSRLLEVSCPAPNWLGVGTSGAEFVGVGVGGIPFSPPAQQYLWECSFTGPNGPWTNCRYSSSPGDGDWQETAGKNIWFKATDSRGDWAVSGDPSDSPARAICQYRRDKTPPVLNPIFVTGTCGASNKPSLSSIVQVNPRVTDNLSQVTVTGQNSTRVSAIVSCPQSPKDGSGCPALPGIAISGVANDSNGQVMRIVATDEALNQTVSTSLQAYSAAGVFTFLVSPGDSSYTQNGLSGASALPYKQGLTATLGGTNNLNFHSSVTLNILGSSLSGSYTGGTWSNPRSGVFFANDGIQSMSASFSDSCGNGSPSQSALVKLDWESPQGFWSNCDDVSRTITGSFTDNQTSVGSVTASCTDGTSDSSGSGSLTLTGFGYGTISCSFDASDSVGNATASPDGRNMIRTQNVTCPFPSATPGPTLPPPTPTPTPTPVPGTCTGRDGASYNEGDHEDTYHFAHPCGACISRRSTCTRSGANLSWSPALWESVICAANLTCPSGQHCVDNPDGTCVPDTCTPDHVCGSVGFPLNCASKPNGSALYDSCGTYCGLENRCPCVPVACGTPPAGSVTGSRWPDSCSTASNPNTNCGPANCPCNSNPAPRSCTNGQLIGNSCGNSTDSSCTASGCCSQPLPSCEAGGTHCPVGTSYTVPASGGACATTCTEGGTCAPPPACVPYQADPGVCPTINESCIPISQTCPSDTSYEPADGTCNPPCTAEDFPPLDCDRHPCNTSCDAGEVCCQTYSGGQLRRRCK